MSRANAPFLVACTTVLVTSACGGANAGQGPVSGPAPLQAPASATAVAPPALSPAEKSAQVGTVRSACSAEAAKQQFDVVDFVTYKPLDESNWDSTIRVRRKGRLVNIGCRYDLKAAVTYVYEPSSADGGNPWGAAGAPTSVGAPPAVAEPRIDAKASTPKTDPKTSTPKSDANASAPKVEAKSPLPRSEPKPAPGATLNLNAIADTSARSAIARTRDGCLAEAARRKIVFDDFDAFRRVDGARWEAMLLINKGKGSSRRCQFDLNNGKATIK